MVKETVTTTTCDLCGDTDSEGHSFFGGREDDGAGRMENVYYHVDLCDLHFGELIRKHGDPKQHFERLVGRSKAMAYGRQVMEWVELQKVIWKKMTPEDRKLALAIEAL